MRNSKIYGYVNPNQEDKNNLFSLVPKAGWIEVRESDPTPAEIEKELLNTLLLSNPTKEGIIQRLVDSPVWDGQIREKDFKFTHEAHRGTFADKSSNGVTATHLPTGLRIYTEIPGNSKAANTTIARNNLINLLKNRNHEKNQSNA